MKRTLRRIVDQGAIFLAASMLGNFVNLAFNFYLGRTLNSTDFALVALFMGIVYIVNVFFNAIAMSASHSIGSTLASERNIVIGRIYYQWSRNAVTIGVILVIAWSMLSPFLSKLWKIEFTDLLFFSPVFIFGTLAYINRGILLGSLKFRNSGAIFLTESFFKLFLAFVIVSTGFVGFTYLSIPVSIIVSCLISYWILQKSSIEKKMPSDIKNSNSRLFSRRFFVFSLLLGLSTLTFLSVDVILAKTFFTPEIAGGYALITLSGKILFLFSSILSGMVVAVVSNAIGEKKNTKVIFRVFFSISFIVVFLVSAFFILFGESLFLLFFGEKVKSVVYIFPSYILSIAEFSLANLIVYYHHARRKFIFPIVASSSSVLLIFGSIAFHATIGQFVDVLFFVATLNLLIISLLHLYSGHLLPQQIKDKNSPALLSPLASEISARTKLPTVTIGLPAYNEEYNIRNILKQILEQKQEGFIIEEIIVASDGSTDNTVEFASEFKEHGVTVISGNKNFGKSYRQNEIVSVTNSDVIVFLDADILLQERTAISRLVSPILNGADLSASWAKPLAPKKFIEKMLYAGFELKHFVYTRYKSGQNIYTCVGAMRAFSKKFYSQIVFPSNSAGEDQYLYLACIKGGFHYKYAGLIDVYFKYPDNFIDYRKYVRRIFQTQKKHGDVFGENFVRDQRHLPLGLIIMSCVYGILKRPFYTPVYLISHIVMQQWAIRQPRLSVEVSKSTKKLLE